MFFAKCHIDNLETFFDIHPMWCWNYPLVNLKATVTSQIQWWQDIIHVPILPGTQTQHRGGLKKILKVRDKTPPLGKPHTAQWLPSLRGQFFKQVIMSQNPTKMQHQVAAILILCNSVSENKALFFLSPGLKFLRTHSTVTENLFLPTASIIKHWPPPAPAPKVAKKKIISKLPPPWNPT